MLEGEQGAVGMDLAASHQEAPAPLRLQWERQSTGPAEGKM